MRENKRGVKTRLDILAFLHTHASARSADENAKCADCIPPSLEEIGEAVGLKSKGAVAYQLKLLRDQGKIVWEPNQRRTIALVEDAPDAQPAELD